MTFIIRFTVFALLHSLGASQRLKSFFVRKSSCEPCWYRLAYCLVSLFFFIYVMAADSNSSVLYFVPGVWSLLLYLTQLAVGIMLVCALYQTGITDFLGIRQLQKKECAPNLITTGWYRIVRHPLYLLSLIFMILTPVMTVQWLLLTVCSLVYFITGACIEEKRLLHQFGDEYRNYMQSTPFLIPHFKHTRVTRHSV